MFAASKTDSASTGDYQISRSLRFNSADSTYLNRTPSASNRKTWTFSAWVKRAVLSSEQQIFSSQPDANNWTEIYYRGTDNLTFRQYVSSAIVFEVVTNALLRDVSAWYHLVIVLDTTQATASNRLKLYINGVDQSLTFNSGTYPTQNSDLFVNAANAHYIGQRSSAVYPNHYMTEVNFIDGTALTPSSFGETDTQTGVWQPKAFAGTYGTNGFYLNFSDNSNTTAATLGKDYSGNGNNWTPNNFSVTAGAGNDSLVDVPTPYGVDTGVGGTVRGNYCTLNPLSNTAGTWSNGNLEFVGPNNNRRSNSTIAVSTGQWYWEVTLGNAPATKSSSSDYNSFGFGLSTVFASTTSPSVQTDALTLSDNAYYKNFSGASTDSGTTFASGDVLSIAVDLDANTFTFRKNNSSLVTGTIGGTAGRELTPIIISYSGAFGVMYANFGQRPFAYTAPSGFKALCTQNLPTPTIGATTATQATQYFTPALYTGTNATQSITTGFQPDLVWIKTRSSVSRNTLFDAVRGVTKVLWSDSTDAEGTANAGTGLTSLNSTGFTLGTEIAGTSGSTNVSGSTYVAWNWRASNATAVTNNAGSVTSTVSANTTAGFSVVTWTGSSAGQTVGHGLGVAPSLIIAKTRNNAGENWPVYHKDLGIGKYLYLSTTNAENSTYPTYWGSSAPTSTIFGTFTGGYPAANNYGSMVAYCFAPVAGYSAFGSYTGNGVADGPFVYTGFRPAYVLAKKSSGIEIWFVLDSKRGTYNVNKPRLNPNNSDAESTGYDIVDFTSNGFKFRNSDTSWNGSGDTYIFAAFAEAPFKYSLAR